jgi:hypothetical protein
MDHMAASVTFGTLAAEGHIVSHALPADKGRGIALTGTRRENRTGKDRGDGAEHPRCCVTHIDQGHGSRHRGTLAGVCSIARDRCHGQGMEPECREDNNGLHLPGVNCAGDPAID